MEKLTRNRLGATSRKKAQVVNSSFFDALCQVEWQEKMNVKAIATRHTDGTWILKLTCPICGKQHTHGGLSGAKPSGGDRLSHCRKDARHYELIVDSVPDQKESANV